MSDSIPRVGALARWHSEMRQGIRGKPANWHTWTFDDLWSAACHEKAALELEAGGDLASAKHFMDWALCRLHGIKDQWDRNAHETKAGKALLAKLRGAAVVSPATVINKPPSEPQRQELPVRTTRRRPVTAGLGLMP